MKNIVLVGLLAILILSGAVLAQQSGEQKSGSSMQGLMEQMPGKRGMGEMMGMMKMMEQMGNMMDQCAAMMEAMHSERVQPKEGQEK